MFPTSHPSPDATLRRLEIDPRTIISNALVHTPSGVLAPGWVSLRGRTIEGVGPGLPPAGTSSELGADVMVDAAGWALVPGFIDLHIHGAVGREAMDADPEGLRAISRFLVRRGVTAYLPTTWAASGRQVMAVLEAVSEVLGKAEGGATILGAHLEGPYLNPRRCGAQPADAIRPPHRTECRMFLDSGVVRILTLAPELEGALELVGDCVERGVVAAAGHTEATYEEMHAAVSAGVSQVTHLFNAMGGLSHRAPGAAVAALALDGLRCELIADGAHVHPAALRVAWRAKGGDGLILVSDAT
ncbi:MAG: N-acetylglucosamine-6-phosphate deacetylase, partial [Acidimicrobiia bacterium]